MVQIIPAILTNSADEFEKIIRLVEPYSARVHLDVADGIFVSNETIKGYSELEVVSTGLKFDVHLMVKAPLMQLSLWNNEKADRFIIHVESPNLDETIRELRGMGKGIGIAINPDTSVEALEHFIDQADFVCFMTVYPGFQGRGFLDHVVEKIKDFRKKYPGVVIFVDGGINLATAKSAVEAGVNGLVSGSFVVKSGNVGKTIAELQEAVQNL